MSVADCPLQIVVGPVRETKSGELSKMKIVSRLKELQAQASEYVRITLSPPSEMPSSIGLMNREADVWLAGIIILSGIKM